MVNGLPSNRDHIVKQRQLLKSFRPQNLEHDVHDNESLQERVILIMDSCCRCSWSKDVVGELNVRCYLVLDQGKHRKTLGNHQNAENHKITLKSQFCYIVGTDLSHNERDGDWAPKNWSSIGTNIIIIMHWLPEVDIHMRSKEGHGDCTQCIMICWWSSLLSSSS